MIDFTAFDRRPIVVAVAGPNGAGKTTFYFSHLQHAGLRFVNADVLADELGMDPYEAAEVATRLRIQLVRDRESFAFETVFSDPAGEKVRFLEAAAAAGYQVVLCFIGLSGPDLSDERVAMRVSQGGHDVPTAKLASRFPRSRANLRTDIQRLPHVLVFDNTDLRTPYRLVASFACGEMVYRAKDLPEWLDREQDRA